jgi:hypothetical protein
VVGDIKLHTKCIFCFVWPVYHQNHAHQSKIQKDFNPEKFLCLGIWKMKYKFGEQGRTENTANPYPAFFTGFTCLLFGVAVQCMYNQKGNEIPNELVITVLTMNLVIHDQLCSQVMRKNA